MASDELNPYAPSATQGLPADSAIVAQGRSTFAVASLTLTGVVLTGTVFAAFMALFFQVASVTFDELVLLFAMSLIVGGGGSVLFAIPIATLLLVFRWAMKPTKSNWHHQEACLFAITTGSLTGFVASWTIASFTWGSIVGAMFLAAFSGGAMFLFAVAVFGQREEVTREENSQALSEPPCTP